MKDMKIANRSDLIKAYVDFFKKQKHKQVPSASLVPVNDPTVLFTTAGMHPLVPYLVGQSHPLGKRLCSVQKCVRTGDIDEVGDEVHHTFFEMLGNWSLGDYFKKEAIEFSFSFLTDVLEIPLEKLAVSVFAGDSDAGRDEVSATLWQKLGVNKKRIAYLPKKNNWWGPAGTTGPCGPDTEMFYWTGKEKAPASFDADDNRWVEIWNDVFMEFNKTVSGSYMPLAQKNVDTGMGVERTVAVLLGISDNYLTPMFKPLIVEIEKLSGKKYETHQKAMRIIADHVRAAVFILGDDQGIKPGNIGQGYVLRRLIRRAVRYGKTLGIHEPFLGKIAHAVFEQYGDYEELSTNRAFILRELSSEEHKFLETLEKGLRAFSKLTSELKGIVPGKEAFLLFQSYGFPIEMTQELANEKGMNVDIEGYNAEYTKHQELSRTLSAGTFKSGLADDSAIIRRLHTATHLLNESLRRVLGDEVRQKGSNITPERLRFDFNFTRKVTSEELAKIEKLVNDKIKAELPMVRTEMSYKDAVKSGAQAEFGAKYPEKVSVYTLEDKHDKHGWFSKELCTGPHVENTREVGTFKILKEEASSAGVRRIKAVVS